MNKKVNLLVSIGCLIVFLIGFLFNCIVNLIANSGFSSEDRYSGYGDLITTYSTEVEETINFTRKEDTYIETFKGVPMYVQLSNFSNSCGPTGGAIVIGFYDRYYEELIPSYVPYFSTGAYKKNDKVYVPQLVGELYSLMRTNVDDVGVSQSDCLTGLRAYVNNRGYSITYSSVKSSSSINVSAYQTAINNNQPTLLFCDKMDLYTIANDTNADILIRSSYYGGHVAVAYGLYTIKYYNGNNNFRTDSYIRIATGLPEIQNGYLKISATDWCNAAYAVSIS